MKLLTIEQFKELTGASDSTLIWLLKQKKFSRITGPDQEIMIDVEAIEVQDLISAKLSQQAELFKQKQSLVEEKCATLINEELEQLLDQALAHYLNRSDQGIK